MKLEQTLSMEEQYLKLFYLPPVWIHHLIL